MAIIPVIVALKFLDGYIEETIQNRHQDLYLTNDKRIKRHGKEKDMEKDKELGLITKQVLKENTPVMDQTLVPLKKRASSESSLQRAKRKGQKFILNANDNFPTVENAVNHFRRKMDAPHVVTISIPLNTRGSVSDNGDEHRLKYHHRSVDEVERMSQNSERLRTVFDEEIDLDYIDIVYEANKPSKQRYMSLSCAPPLTSKSLSRRIKLQQREDSKEKQVNENNDFPEDFGETYNNMQNQKLPIDCLEGSKKKLEPHIASYMHPSKTRSLMCTEPKKSSNETDPDLSSKPVYYGMTSSGKINKFSPFSVGHRYSYLNKSNLLLEGVNRANSKDLREIFRYSKNINQNFKTKH